MQTIEVIALLGVCILITLSFINLFFCLFYICDKDFRKYFNQKLVNEITGRQERVEML